MNDERVLTSSNSSSTSNEERARVRRNQRNSRARKQAYVQDLEQRWNECVRLGAQATVEMQREARRVQKENSILRALLYKQGFDDMAIQEAVVIAERAEGSETPLPAFHRSPEHLIATGIDLALPETQHHIQNHIGPNAPQICPQGLPQALTFEGNAAPLEVQANIPQELNFNDWLMDLCNIKDAFGIDIFAADQPFLDGGDSFGTPQEVPPHLAISDAQHSQPLSAQDNTASGDLDLQQERDCGNPDWGNMYYT